MQQYRFLSNMLLSKRKHLFKSMPCMDPFTRSSKTAKWEARIVAALGELLIGGGWAFE